MRSKIRRGLGIGYEACEWEWAGPARLFLSRWLRIGHWFGAYEECVDCGAPAIDVDFAFERVGIGKARCCDRGACDECAEENARYWAQASTPKARPATLYRAGGWSVTHERL